LENISDLRKENIWIALAADRDKPDCAN